MDDSEVQKFLDEVNWDDVKPEPEISDALKLPELPKTFDIEFVKQKIQEVYRSIREFQRGLVYKDFKSEKKSLAFISRGNTLFKQGLLERALNVFTKAVAFAPKKSLELGFAYASRSEVFYTDRSYYHALLDSNRSLECDIPERLKKVVVERKARCIGRVREELKRRFKIDEKTLNLDASDPHEMNPFGKEKYDPYPTNDDEALRECPKVLLRVYMQVELSVNKFPDGTPYMVMRTLRDVKDGEIVCIEKLFACTLDESNFTTHCDYCLEKCFNPIPCLTCTKVMYCGNACREAALELYHRVECKLINFYGHSRTEWLAFRTFLAGTGQGKTLRALMALLEPENIFKNECDYNFHTNSRIINSYVYTLWLSGEFSEEMLAWRTSRNETITWVVQAIIALQEECFFEGEYSQKDCLTEKELYAALLLLHGYISTGRKKPFAINHWRMVRRDPAFSYIVCCWQDLLKSIERPNTQAFYVDRYRILYANRPIKAGEAITYA